MYTIYFVIERSGCQAEIGTACSMASAGLAKMMGIELEQIEYTAEVAMEHHLGLANWFDYIKSSQRKRS